MPETFVQDWPIWVAFAYVVATQTLPKLAPDLFKFLSAKVSTEERLFKLLEQNTINSLHLTETLIKLQLSIDGLSHTLTTLDQRVEVIEDVLADSSTRSLLNWLHSQPQYTEWVREGKGGK